MTTTKLNEDRYAVQDDDSLVMGIAKRPPRSGLENSPRDGIRPCRVAAIGDAEADAKKQALFEN
jgi:hypothetical protein